MSGHQLSSVVEINSLIWITSLHQHEKGSTDRLHDDLQPYFLSIGLPFHSFEPSSAAELLSFLDEIAARARSGSKPIIHLDTHGSEKEGIGITRSGETIPWKTIVNSLRPINVATGNNLCVVSAACSSMHVIKQITITEASPFFILIAPEQEVSFGFIEDNTPRFYEAVFKGSDITSVYRTYLQSRLKLFHCEQVLAVGLVRYVRRYCMGKGGQQRREKLLTETLTERHIPNTPQNRRLIREQIKSRTRPTQELIDRYVARFLIGKKIDYDINVILRLARSQRGEETATSLQ
jgi:hypothetical protein